MQNDKNNKGSFKWIHLLTLKCWKIYRKFMSENKMTPPLSSSSSSYYFEFCWIRNCWGGVAQTVIQEDIGGKPCRQPSCSCSCRAYSHQKTRNNGQSPVLLTLCSEAVRLVMEVPGGQDLWSVLRHQCSVLVKHKGCCRDREAQAQQAGEGQQQLRHGDGCVVDRCAENRECELLLIL
jgi:hypothetical protein